MARQSRSLRTEALLSGIRQGFGLGENPPLIEGAMFNPGMRRQRQDSGGWWRHRPPLAFLAQRQ